MYVHDHLAYTRIPIEEGSEDLQSISIEAGSKNSSKFILNSIYREHTDAVYGFNNLEMQQERLRRQIKHWDVLHQKNQDTIINEDINVDFLRWADDSYHLAKLVDMLQVFSINNMT